MRNLKKLFAVLLTVAMLATMFVAPAMAEENSDAQLVKDLGVLVGDGGDFSEYLTKAPTKMTTLILTLRLLGLEEEAYAYTEWASENFTDAEIFSVKNQNLMAYAKANGIVVGNGDGTLGASKEATGKEFIAMMLNALGYEANVDYTWSTVLGTAATAGLSSLVDMTGAINNGNMATGLVVALKANKKGAETTLAQTLVEAGVIDAQVAQDSMLVAAPTATPTPTPVVLAVESVTAINLKQMVVVFSGTVDKTAAETKTNYTFDSADLAAGDVVKLNEDGMSVTITRAAAVSPNQTTKKLVVETGVKDTAGTKLAADASFDVNFTDTTVPYIVKAVQMAPNKIKVYFNEPVQDTAGTEFQVDNGTLSAVIGAISATEYSVEVTLGAKITSGTHTVKVNPSSSTAIKDFAGFAVPSASVDFEAVADTTAPTATVTANSQTELLVEFSEEVTGFTNSDIYHTTTGYTADSVTAVTGSTTQYKVAFTTNPLPTGTAVVVIKKEAVTDLFDNKFGEATTYNVAVNSDTTAPTVTNVEVSNENVLKVTYSEAVTGSTVSSNYVIKDTAGVAVVNKSYANASGNPIGTITYADKVATITFAANVAKGDYLLEIKNIKDSAVNPNTITTSTYAFTIADKTKPTANSVTLINSKKLVVEFSESMKIEGDNSILDSTKYTLAGSALPSGATLTAGTNNASVIIQLPDSHAGVANGVAVQVGQVADAAGNKTVNLATSLTAGSATAATIVTSQVKAISTTTVTVEINKPLQNIVVDDFTVNAKPVTSAVYENKTLADGATYGALVTLSVADGNKWNTDTTPSVVVTAATGGIETKDTLGTVIAANGGVTAADKIAPQVAKYTAANGTEYSDIRAYDAAGSDSKLDRIEIRYTEDIFAGSVGIQSYEIEGYTIVGVALVDSDGAGAGGDGLANDLVRLTVTQKDTADTAAAPNVKQVLVIQDDLSAGLRNNKAVEADYTASIDQIVPTLDSATVATVTGANNDLVTLNFSEPLKETVAEAAAVISDIAVKTGGVSRAINSTTATLSEDGKSLSFVLTESDNAVYTNDTFEITYTNDNANELIDVANVEAAKQNEVATTTVTGFVTGAVADSNKPDVMTLAGTYTNNTATDVEAGETVIITFNEKLTAASVTALIADLTATFANSLDGNNDGTVSETTATGGPTRITITASTGAITGGDDISTPLTITANVLVDNAGNTQDAAVNID